MIYKPSNFTLNEGTDTIDARNINYYRAQANVRGSLVYGYELFIYDMQGNSLYSDTEMQVLDDPAGDGEIVSVQLPDEILHNGNDYQIKVRFYNQEKGSQDKYDTEITKARIKGSTKSVLWVKVAEDEELRSKIYGCITEYKAKGVELQTLEYKTEVATMIVNASLSDYSDQICTEVISMLVDEVSNTDERVSTIISDRKKEKIDNIKYDRYIQIEEEVGNYGKRFIITPEESEEGTELPKTNTFTERKKITWVDTYNDWLYIELDMSATKDETKGLTYMPTDGSKFDLYDVSSDFDFDTFYVDLEVCENTCDIGNYVLFYATAEEALAAHQAGDVPGSPYTVQPVYNEAYKIIRVDVTTGEVGIDGLLPSVPKIGYVPRFFVYDTLTETYTEQKVGYQKIRYKVPTNSDYYDLDGTLDGKIYDYYYYDSPNDVGTTAKIKGYFNPNSDPENINTGTLTSPPYGPDKRKRSNHEIYYMEFVSPNDMAAIEYSAPTPFKIHKACIGQTGYIEYFEELPSDYTLYYSLDGTTWDTMVNGRYAAVMQSDGNYKIWIRGTGGNVTTWRYPHSGYAIYNYIRTVSNNNDISVRGNLDALWDYTKVGTGGITHTGDKYAEKLFYRLTNIVDASGIVYPTSRTTDCFKDMFFECTSLQKYPVNGKVYLDPREAMNGIKNASKICLRSLSSPGFNTPYTEVAYTDGNMAGKFNALTDKKMGLAFVNEQPYGYENYWEVETVQNYIFRTYNYNITENVYTGANLSEGVMLLKKDTVSTSEIPNCLLIGSTEVPTVYYDSRCLHKKGSLALTTATVVNDKVAKIDNAEYYIALPNEIEVTAFTQYYKDQGCKEYLGETPRYFFGKGSRVAPNLGKLILEDGSTVYIKLTDKFKVIANTPMYSDINLKEYVGKMDYSSQPKTEGLGTTYYTNDEQITALGTITLEDSADCVIDDRTNTLVALNSGIFYQKQVDSDNWIEISTISESVATELRYACCRYITRTTGNKIYVSRDAITWEEVITDGASYLYTCEDTIIILLESEGFLVSYNGVNFEYIDSGFIATSVAYSMGMFHFLSGGTKLYSTTNFVDYIETSISTSLDLDSTMYTLYVIGSSSTLCYNQDGVRTINTGRITAGIRARVYPLDSGESVLVDANQYTDNIFDYGSEEPVTHASTTVVYPYNNFNTFVKATSEEKLSSAVITQGKAGDTVFGVKGIEAEVIDYRTLRAGDYYFNNSTTMMLKGPIVCEDGYVAGGDKYEIFSPRLSIFIGEYGKESPRTIFFPTPQRNNIYSGDIFSDIEMTNNIGSITSTDGYEYQFIDMTVSALYNGTEMIGYCATPIENYMIEGTELFDDMDFTHSVGKYESEYNVPCYVKYEEINKVLPLAANSAESSVSVEFIEGMFAIKNYYSSSYVYGIFSHLSRVGSTLGLEYYGENYIYNNINNKDYYLDPIGDWYLTKNGTKLEEYNYEYVILERITYGSGYEYNYHKTNQPTKCVSPLLVYGHDISTYSPDLKEFKEMVRPYTEETSVIMKGKKYDFIRINGSYRKAEVFIKHNKSYKYKSSSYWHTTLWYLLDTNKFSYYNDTVASIYNSVDDNYLYFALPAAGKTTEPMNVYNIEYDFEGKPVKGYIYIGDKMYKVKDSAIVEDTGLEMIDVKKYKEQQVGGNPITIVKDLRVESNNTDRLFITPNVNIGEDLTNPMQIIFNNDTMFGVEKIDEFGDVYIIKNKGGVPLDENENIYPGCEYRVSTCFIEQDPTMRFHCRSTPDVKIEQNGNGVVSWTRKDPAQNTENRNGTIYKWSLFKMKNFRMELIDTWESYDYYIMLDLVGYSDFTYMVVCQVEGVTTSINFTPITVTMQTEERVTVTDDCLGYKFTINNNTTVYKYKPGDYYLEKVGIYKEAGEKVDYDVEFGEEYIYVFTEDGINFFGYNAPALKSQGFTLTNSKLDSFTFDLGYTVGSVTLNIEKTLNDSLSQYGKVSVKEKEFASGSLSTLLGVMGENGYEEAESFGQQKDKLTRWKKFASKGDTLLYRTPRGERYYIKITESPTYTVNDITNLRETKIDFNWSEVDKGDIKFSTEGWDG